MPQTIVWDGTADGKVQKDGRYAFRVFATSASGATASSAQATAPGTPAKAVPGSFLFQRNIFPIRGSHYFGTGAAAFGGGRGHQGQDVFAKCGTPLVAAHAGRVKFKQYQSAAGNYLVIDGDHTGYDFAYMHMRDGGARRPGRPRLHRPADRLRRRHRPRLRLPPALRGLEGAGVVLGRLADRPAADAVGVGQDLVVVRGSRRTSTAAG